LTPPKGLILRLRQVPVIDASSAAVSTGFVDQAHKPGIRIARPACSPSRAPC
jgi:hypothetical protein